MTVSGSHVVINSERPSTAESARPPPIPFPTVIRSGTTSSCSDAHMAAAAPEAALDLVEDEQRAGAIAKPPQTCEEAGGWDHYTAVPLGTPRAAPLPEGAHAGALDGANPLAHALGRLGHCSTIVRLCSRANCWT